MKRILPLVALACLAPSADAGCGKLAKFNPFKARKERRAAEACANALPVGPPAVSVTVAAPAVPVAATVGVSVLTYGAPFCAGGKCSIKVRAR